MALPSSENFGTKNTESSSVLDVNMIRGNAQILQPQECTPFSVSECEDIRNRLLAFPSDTWREAAIARAHEGNPQNVVRPIRSALLTKALMPEWAWLFVRLRTVLANINNEVYRFRLNGLDSTDWPNFIKYEASRSDHYTTHHDLVAAKPTRKLSFSVQLSDESSYEGGDLLFLPSQRRANRAVGTLTCFPSYLSHSVLPVTAGTRFTLVGWVHGPSFS